MRTRAAESHLICSLELPLVPAHQPLLGQWDRGDSSALCSLCSSRSENSKYRRRGKFVSCPETAPAKARMQQQHFPGALEDLLKALLTMTNLSTHSWGPTGADGQTGSRAEERRANLWTRERTEVHCCRDVGLNHLLAPEIHFLKLLYPMAKQSSLSDSLSSELHCEQQPDSKCEWPLPCSFV